MNTWLGLGIFGLFLFIIVIIIIPLLASLFWIWMLIDCAQRSFKDKTDKIVWILIIVLLHVIGAILYYLMIKRKR